MAGQDQLFGRSMLCLPILKFSHSTLPRYASPSGWNHIQAPDLYMLIEQADSNTGIQLRVVQGTNDLEILPLTDIIHQTRELHRRQPKQSPDNLPIFGLTKNTALAIRYFCQNNQVRHKVRRIQLRFDSDESCNEAVKLLTNHGLLFSVPTKKQDTQPQSRPATASSFSGRQPSVQPARFDRGTSSIIVPTIQDAFPSTPSPVFQQTDQHVQNHQQQFPDPHMFTSTPGTHERFAQPHEALRQTTFAPIRTSEERPSTAPIKWPSEMITDFLPPRRELPFPKPISSSAKPKILPPLPRPSYASEKSKQIASPGNKEDRVFATNEGHPSGHKPFPRLATPRGPTRFEPPTSRNYNPPSETDTLSDHPSTSHSAYTSGNATGEQRHSEASYYPSSDLPLPGSISGSPLRTSSPLAQDPQTAALPDPAGAEQLKRYAEQNDETRMDALNKFIIDHIDNDDFLKLCQDVEACWRRTAMGRPK